MVRAALRTLPKLEAERRLNYISDYRVAKGTAPRETSARVLASLNRAANTGADRPLRPGTGPPPLVRVVEKKRRVTGTVLQWLERSKRGQDN